MSAHTQGPWAVWPMGRTLVISCTGRGGKRHPQEGMHVAHVTMPDLNKEWDQLWEANARLIASAPDLLSIAQQWAALDGGAWDVQRHASEKTALLALTREVIAKATGEQDGR